jgi:NAD/NADP transhydrogenase alpha subunit
MPTRPAKLPADASALFARNLYNFLSAFWDKEAGQTGARRGNRRCDPSDAGRQGRQRTAAGGSVMDFISILSIFVLACFVGYYVVWSVTPALHTPLMAVTNAISSVIVVGALIAGRRRVARSPSGWGCWRWCWPASTSSAASR